MVSTTCSPLEQRQGFGNTPGILGRVEDVEHLCQFAQSGELPLAGGLGDRLRAQKGEHMSRAQVNGGVLLLQTPLSPQLEGLPVDASAGCRNLTQRGIGQLVERLIEGLR